MIPKKILPNKGRHSIPPNISNDRMAMVGKFVRTSTTFVKNNPEGK